MSGPLGSRAPSRISGAPDRGAARPGPGRPSALVLLALAAIVVCALGLRRRGLDHGLPCRTEPDVFAIGQVEMARPGSIEGARADDPDLSLDAASAYPTVYSRLMLAWPLPAPRPPAATLGEALERAGEAFLRARLVAALLGVLLVPATFLLARRFVPDGAALFASALIATSLLHVNFSQQARPHVVVATTATLALVAALRARSLGGVANHALAWAATVAAVGSLHNGVLCVLPLALSYALPRGDGHSRRGRRIALALAVPAAALALALAVFYPLRGSDSAEPLSESLVVTEHLTRLEGYDGTGFAQLFRGVAAYDPVLLALGLAGLLVLAILAIRPARSGAPVPRGLSSRRDAAVVLSYGVPYLLVFGAYGASSARYALPLLPLLALAAAAGLRVCFSRVRTGAAVFAPVLAMGALLAFPAYAAARLVSLRAAPDSSDRAVEWLRGNAAPAGGACFLTPGLDLALSRTPEALRAGAQHTLGVLRQPWLRIQADADDAPGRTEPAGERWPLFTMPFTDEAFARQLRADSAGAMRALGATVVIVGLTADGPLSPMMRRIRAGLRSAGAERVAVIAPWVDGAGQPRPLLHQETRRPEASFLAALLRARMDGPALEIYRFGD